MSKAWIRKKRPEFMRDVLRDFCFASVALEDQFRYFDRYKRLRFDVLRDMLGEEMNKGLLWRLKDTAHHLFRNANDDRQVGRLLDWCMGYIFHETIKLKEDAYQQSNYGPWFREMQSLSLPEEEAIVTQDLFQVVLQTRESIRREIQRIRFILYHCRRLLPVYLEPHKDNELLARLIFEQNDLIRQVFGSVYDVLITTLYGDEPMQLYIQAARSLRQGGWLDKAAEAMDAAVRRWPDDTLVLQERQIIDNWEKGIHAF